MRSPFDNPCRHDLRAAACFEPTTAILIGMTVLSAVVSAAGALSAGNAAAGQAGQNAMIARQQADLAQQQGVLAADRQRRQGLIDRGKSLSVLSASGVDVFEGSPLDLLSQQTKENEFQAEQKKFQYDEQAWQMRMGAVGQDMAGAAATARGQSAALGALVGGGAKLAGQIDFGTGGISPAAAPAGGYTIDNLRSSGLPGATVAA